MRQPSPSKSCFLYVMRKSLHAALLVKCSESLLGAEGRVLASTLGVLGGSSVLMMLCSVGF